MEHTLEIVAKNAGITDIDDFKAFAKKNPRKYGIVEENGMTTTTLFVPNLLADYTNYRIEEDEYLDMHPDDQD